MKCFITASDLEKWMKGRNERMRQRKPYGVRLEGPHFIFWKWKADVKLQQAATMTFVWPYSTSSTLTQWPHAAWNNSNTIQTIYNGKKWRCTRSPHGNSWGIRDVCFMKKHGVLSQSFVSVSWSTNCSHFASGAADEPFVMRTMQSNEMSMKSTKCKGLQVYVVA